MGWESDFGLYVRRFDSGRAETCLVDPTLGRRLAIEQVAKRIALEGDWVAHGALVSIANAAFDQHDLFEPMDASARSNIPFPFGFELFTQEGLPDHVLGSQIFASIGDHGQLRLRPGEVLVGSTRSETFAERNGRRVAGLAYVTADVHLSSERLITVKKVEAKERRRESVVDSPLLEVVLESKAPLLSLVVDTVNLGAQTRALFAPTQKWWNCCVLPLQWIRRVVVVDSESTPKGSRLMRAIRSVLPDLGGPQVSFEFAMPDSSLALYGLKFPNAQSALDFGRLVGRTCASIQQLPSTETTDTDSKDDGQYLRTTTKTVISLANNMLAGINFNEEPQ